MDGQVWDGRRLGCLWTMDSADRDGVELAQCCCRAPGPLLLEAKLSVWGLSSFGGSLVAGGDIGSGGHPSKWDGDKEEEALSGLFLSQPFQNTGTNISYIPQ